MGNPTAYEDLGYGWSPDDEASKPSAPTATSDEPSSDQIYLADVLSRVAPEGRISEVALVKLNRRYGLSVVTAALRSARMASSDIHSAYAYVDKLCRAAK